MIAGILRPDGLGTSNVFIAKGRAVGDHHHGGAWTRSNKDQCSYIAPGLVAAGINVLVLDFALAPTVSLDEIVRQNRAAIAWPGTMRIPMAGTAIRSTVSGILRAGTSAA